MLRFVARRLGWSLLVLWFVISVTFVIAVALPADPVRAHLGPHADAATVKRERARLCLDRSWVERYACYVAPLAKGDLGRSQRLRQPVTKVLARSIWPTVELALAALALQLAIGVPLGVLAARRKHRAADAFAQSAALVGQSAPTFLIGPLLMYVFAYATGWFPISGHGEGFWGRLHHLFLPALTLALGGMALYARLVRSEMIEQLSEDYVRSARAKGMSERRVVWRHAFANAMLPVVTVAALDLGTLLGGAIVTEHIFAWPGIGREAVLSIMNLDLPLILGVVLVAAVAILVVNLLVDLLYAWLDPRVRSR